MKTSTKASLIAITALLSILPTVVASAGPVRPVAVTGMTLGWHIGDEYLAAFDPSFGVPSVTMAAENGDTIEVEGTGTLSVHSKSVSGGGTFVHNLANGTEFASDTWKATELIAFVSYGDASAQDLPSNLFGGMAKMRVEIFVGETHVADGILTIFCSLGDKIPAVHREGITLVVQDVINFNKIVSGFTVFNQA